MKIKLAERKEVEVERDVKFPVYSEHYGSEYTRIHSDLSAMSIDKNSSRTDVTVFEVQFEDKYKFDSSGIDYHLGLGVYKSSKEEFCEILDELIDRLQHAKKVINLKEKK